MSEQKQEPLTAFNCDDLCICGHVRFDHEDVFMGMCFHECECKGFNLQEKK